MLFARSGCFSVSHLVLLWAWSVTPTEFWLQSHQNYSELKAAVMLQREWGAVQDPIVETHEVSLHWLSRIASVQVWWLKISSLKMNFFHMEILETNLESQCGFFITRGRREVAILELFSSQLLWCACKSRAARRRCQKSTVRGRMLVLDVCACILCNWTLPRYSNKSLPSRTS